MTFLRFLLVLPPACVIFAGVINHRTMSRPNKKAEPPPENGSSDNRIYVAREVAVALKNEEGVSGTEEEQQAVKSIPTLAFLDQDLSTEARSWLVWALGQYRAQLKNPKGVSYKGLAKEIGLGLIGEGRYDTEIFEKD